MSWDDLGEDSDGDDGEGENMDTCNTTSKRFSIRSTTSTRSIRPMPMSVSSTAAKRQTKSVMALNVAEPEDVEYLMTSTKAENSDLHMGFGRGFILRPPEDWDSFRRSRFRQLCTALGFKPQLMGEKVSYQMNNSMVSPVGYKSSSSEPICLFALAIDTS